MEKNVCCICKKVFYGFGNNPSPLDRSDRICCDECNRTIVRTERIRIMNYQMHLQSEGIEANKF